MKRFITYLFTYENGVKEKNIGFIRSTLRDDIWELDLHIQGMGRYQGNGQIFVLYYEEGLTGALVGDVAMNQGRGSSRLLCKVGDLLPETIDIHQVAGVGIRFEPSVYAASSWTDETSDDFCRNRFSLWKKEEDEPLQLNAQSEWVRLAAERIHFDMEPVQEFVQDPAQKSDCESIQEPAQELGEELHQEMFRRIDISDIKKLPKKNWYLCNNSFLIHGFFNYHYLIVTEQEENGVKKSYLGVPGIYEKPERMMAMLFGFSDFKTQEELETIPDETAPPQEEDWDQEMEESNRNENKPEPYSLEGKFGYWLCILDM